MDIRNWPMDRIMQLPDCAFGRRWPINICLVGFGGIQGWGISEAALPEKTVIWELVVLTAVHATIPASIRLGLGDQVPTSAVEMTACERLFPTIEGAFGTKFLLRMCQRLGLVFTRLRMPLDSKGRRLVGEVSPQVGESCNINVGIVISSIPTEVPDWLCSGRV